MNELRKIQLRYFKKDDIKLKVKWINDQNINKYLHYDLPLCEERTLNWYQSIMSNSTREDFVYELEDCDKNIPLGLIGLINIDFKNKKAEFYIINGEKKYWGKGFASKASIQFLKLMFLKHGLNKIYLYTEAENNPAQRLFESIGFQKEGLLKEDLFYMGQYVDRYIYGINRKDFITNE